MGHFPSQKNNHNIFKPDLPSLKGNFEEISVLDRTSKFRNNPVERPIQPIEMERIKMMYEMFNQQKNAWPQENARGFPPGFARPIPNSPGFMNHPEIYQNRHQYQGFTPANQMKWMSHDNQNIFRNQNIPFQPKIKKGFDREMKDDSGLENSEMGTRVSELERMIDMIEKANTELSSLICQSNSDFMNFKKKVSMCSARVQDIKKDEQKRITRSAEMNRERQQIRLLKSKLEGLTKKTISQLNSVFLDENGSINCSKTQELTSINLKNYSYSKKGKNDEYYSGKILELKEKISGLTRKHKKEIEKLNKRYKKSNENMEKEFRSLYNEINKKNKILIEKTKKLEKEKFENIERIQKLLDVKKKKEVMIEYLSKTLLLSKTEIEGLGQKAEQITEENDHQVNHLSKQNENLEAELNECRKNENKFKTDIEKLQKTNKKLETQFKESVEEAQKVKETLKMKEIIIETKIGEIENLNKIVCEIRQNSKKGDESNLEIKRLEKENSKQKHKIQELEKKTKKLKKKTIKQDELIDEYEKELIEKNNMVLDLNNEIEENKNNSEEKEKCHKLIKENEGLKKCLSEMEEAISESINVRNNKRNKTKIKKKT